MNYEMIEQHTHTHTSYIVVFFLSIQSYMYFLHFVFNAYLFRDWPNISQCSDALNLVVGLHHGHESSILVIHAPDVWNWTNCSTHFRFSRREFVIMSPQGSKNYVGSK